MITRNRAKGAADAINKADLGRIGTDSEKWRLFCVEGIVVIIALLLYRVSIVITGP